MSANASIQDSYGNLIDAMNKIAGASMLLSAQAGHLPVVKDIIRFVEEMREAEFSLTDALSEAGIID